jgi:hypothetical protein
MRALLGTTPLLAALALTGCVTNPIVGHASLASGRYRGDVGITGNGCKVTIQSGSDVSTLKFVGDASTVFVEDGALVRRIEFWGTGNEVSIPDVLNPIVASVGANKVDRRPLGQVAPQADRPPGQ